MRGNLAEEDEEETTERCRREMEQKEAKENG